MSKHLVIVESPTKARTIKKFLGKDFIVESSMGHVRDLPTNTLAVDTKSDFEPTYVIPKEKQTVIKHLKAAMKEADDVWIATDEDREGEAIGWHLTQALGLKNVDKIKRIVFHEITESAIKEATEHPRTLDMNLVNAQQGRRILDRLVGYTLSPFLWKKVYRGLSAGRVQSVVVRLIVDREREIRAFNAEEYWTISANLETGKEEEFVADLKEKEGEKFMPVNQKESDEVVSDLEGASWQVAKIETKELKKTPAAPFTTSTLQQEASRKLGFSVKQTMVVAQQLYEGVNMGKGQGHTGLITYMRTDSVNLSQKALDDSKDMIEKTYGREYVLSEPRKYKQKSKGAQEAHEAIRPTEMNRSPESLADVLDSQQLKLYTLIWNRTIATQMAAAELKRVGADILAKGKKEYTFRATGQTILFDGFLRVYLEGRDEETPENEAGDGEKFLPNLEEGEGLKLDELLPEQHFTKPPARYTEASLVKKLEEEGIGRPSTYAPTISTVQQRGYIQKEGKQLLPADVAFAVTDLLTEHFSDIVNLQFTAKMEQRLDDIAEAKEELVPFLKTFFDPFEKLVEQKSEEIKKEDAVMVHELGTDPKTGLMVIARLGRFGPYVQLGAWEKEEKPKRRKKGDPKPEKKDKPKAASLLPGMRLDTITLEDALHLLSFPKPLGTFNDEKIELHLGRFGPYLKAGKLTASLDKDMHPFTVTEEMAKELLSKTNERKTAGPLKELGTDPVSGNPILLKDGRFGPYITDGKTNASLGKKLDPETITHEQAVEHLQKKRDAPPRKWGRGAKKK